MRILTSARSPRADDLAGEAGGIPIPSRWLRLGAAGAAAMLLAGLGVGATASPARAVTISWFCDSGSYKPAIGRLGALPCTGSGATDVYVSVSVLDVVNGPEDVGAILYCTDFGFAGTAPQHAAGDCVVYSYS
jgi:hypothetical protein